MGPNLDLDLYLTSGLKAGRPIYLESIPDWSRFKLLQDRDSCHSKFGNISISSFVILNIDLDPNSNAMVTFFDFQ